jgi:hypothetical protein
LVVGPGELLRNELARCRYLGPLRETPSREHRPPRFSDPSRWATGLAAWDVLHRESDEFVEKASDWLSMKERLDAGYRIQAKSVKELDLGSPLAGMLMSGLPLDSLEDIREELNEIPTRRRFFLIDEQTAVEVQPQDVGVGISQLIPVVVLALEDRSDLAAVEQPELHIHPRIQVGLGDLFIWAVTERPSARFLIETHSEHLILRLSRRIRETTEGDLQTNRFPSVRPDQIAVYYVENSGGRTAFKPLRLDETGEFIDRWPGGFFEERAKELF